MNLLSLFDVSAAQIKQLLKTASAIKAHPEGYTECLKGRSVAMVFEKPSLRTRVSFEVGIQQLGGQAIYLDAQMIEPGQRESVEDIARNLSCWTDAIVARVFKHNTLKQLTAANLPVVNALCDQHHPCQSLADLLTIQERYPVDLRVVDILYLGEGNNVCQSLMVGAAALGLKLTVITPPGFAPRAEFMAELNKHYPEHGIQLGTDLDAVQHADVVYTDTWISMGDTRSEAETLEIFMPYQVNQALVERLQATTVLHCLPAHRNHEVTDEVLDGPISTVLQQAENRLYVQKAVLHTMFKEKNQ
ncbi:ornithine carbamoyltransferase [Aliidiomarina taiwanensis]|uniref:Ornithine carbamoyltransferase n=1 Tax=Aliidiomarina taiwanensis TaxID=946228 RepID=A0A432X9A1_9GAMM|nr:ornithine carbamoyltransferase [Aliidiomarina taiwanensis]RUO43993.1 ornithine carbamoyltransferase [Aliidiomarina taiwanensis]